MTPNVYRAANGWTSGDMTIVQFLTGRIPDVLSTTRWTFLCNWIAEAPTKEPAR